MKIKEVDFTILKDKVINKIDRVKIDGNDELHFFTNENEQFIMYHDQDCCEQVYIEDIAGDLDDICGAPIIFATEDTNRSKDDIYDESHTWTFYNIRSIKGHVTIRWHGQSNGNYSESVSFCKVINYN